MKQTILFLVLIVGVNQGSAKSQNCEEDYIPAHSYNELIAVKKWAVGAAFSVHAENAGYKFDVKAYKEDNPNEEIFNFGRAIGGMCWDNYVVVTDWAESMLTVLDIKWRAVIQSDGELQEKFQNHFDEKASELNFAQYLEPLEDEDQIDSEELMASL